MGKIVNLKEVQEVIDNYAFFDSPSTISNEFRLYCEEHNLGLEGLDVLCEMITEKTGYNNSTRCPLCVMVSHSPLICIGCVHKEVDGYRCNSTQSPGIEQYEAIENAEDYDEMFQALQNRIEYLEGLQKRAQLHNQKEGVTDGR